MVEEKKFQRKEQKSRQKTLMFAFSSRGKNHSARHVRGRQRGQVKFMAGWEGAMSTLTSL